MKNTVISLMLILIAVCLSLFVLVQFSFRPNKVKNGFRRNWLPSATALNEIRTEETYDRIGSTTSTKFYFFGYDARNLLTTDSLLKSKTIIKLNVPFFAGIVSAQNLLVDYSTIYFYSGEYSVIMNCKFTDTTVQATKLTAPLFTRSIPISTEKVALRAFDSLRYTQKFEIANTKTGMILQEAAIFKNQTDGGISTDGLFAYDRTKHKIFYLQTYQNRFLCLDTNLNIIYRGKTIDTTNTNHMTTRTFFEKGATVGKTTSAKPISPVNKECCADNGHLFVLSTLQADNENSRPFLSNSVVDVYRTDNGNYEGSFYIPNVKGKKVIRISASNKILMALYGKNIVSYRLPELY